MRHAIKKSFWITVGLILLTFSNAPWVIAAEKLVGIYSAQVMSQYLPLIALEAGLFRKYQIDFEPVFISSAGIATAAMLGGESDVSLAGGVGNVRAYVQGASDLVFIGGFKNVMTQSIVTKTEIKKPGDLRGKRIGVSRIGGNLHYFAVQALRRFGLEPVRDFTFVQTGGVPETLTALVYNHIDAATLTAPIDAKAIAMGFSYALYGPDLRIPYAATAFATRRSIITKRAVVLGQFMRTMAEAAKIMHTDRELTYLILKRQLGINDRSILDASYNGEIKALEQKLDLRPEGIQAIIDEVSQIDPRSAKVKVQDLVDRRFLDEMQSSGFFDRLWGHKR